MVPNCPVCLEAASLPLASLEAMPLIGCRFFGSQPEALSAPVGRMELVLCPACSHVYNRAFEPERMQYSAGYDNALGYSGRYREYQTATVNRLIASYALRRKTIVDIGCGSADFLSLICSQGANRGVGYDPTQPARTMPAGDGSVTVVADMFRSEKQEPVDFVCSQHVLEHLWDLGPTLRDARKILKPQGGAYFEVPNGMASFSGHGIWDLTYEHLSYFSPESLQRALSLAGFPAAHLRTSFGDQYLCAEVRAGQPQDSAEPTKQSSDISLTFPDELAGLLAAWREHLAGMISAGRRIVLWGAGTKAVSLVNMLGLQADQIEYVVDINPRKAGRFLPGMGQKVISPDELCDIRPDIVLVMNPQYTEEVEAKLEAMGVRCDFLSIDTCEVP